HLPTRPRRRRRPGRRPPRLPPGVGAMSVAAATAFRSGANVAVASIGPDVEREPVDLVAEDGGVSRGVLYTPRGTRPTVGVHLMHPRTDQSRNYNVPPLVAAGYAVLARAGRWVNNDIDPEHERLLPDVAA